MGGGKKEWCEKGTEDRYREKEEIGEGKKD